MKTPRFVNPKKRYYFGRIRYGAPYFYPRNFNSTILKIRKLELRTEDEYCAYIDKYPHLKELNDAYFSNLPMVRRSSYWVKKIGSNWYFIEIGWPIRVIKYGLGWKDKFESPRYEWSPSFQIYFFLWQFCIFWNAPDGDNDKYYEMKLWAEEYCLGDIEKARNTWGWVDHETNKSTWDDKYIIWK